MPVVHPWRDDFTRLVCLLQHKRSVHVLFSCEKLTKAALDDCTRLPLRIHKLPKAFAASWIARFLLASELRRKIGVDLVVSAPGSAASILDRAATYIRSSFWEFTLPPTESPRLDSINARQPIPQPAEFASEIHVEVKSISGRPDVWDEMNNEANSRPSLL